MLSVLFLLFLLCGLPSVALAHKVNVWAYVEGDTVFTESYFPDGRKCQNCTITVYDAKGNKLLEGKTDTEGSFSFKAPVKTDLLMVLDAGMGHRAEYKLAASELPQTLPAAPVGEAVTVPETPVPTVQVLEPPSVESAAGPQAQIPIAALESALEKKLAPIRKMMQEARDKTGFTEVVGGIGYIFGIMGVVMYFTSRNRKRYKDQK